VLGQNSFTPQGTLSTTNFYGIAGTLNLNLSTSNLTGASTFNAAGVFGSVVLAGNNGSSSSRALRAVQGGFVVNGNVLVNDLRALAARTPEVSGTNTIVNAYGCYIDTQKVTGVTNGWGVYQVGSTDINFFEGEIRPNSSTQLRWASRSQITSPSDGSILLRNNAGTGFTKLQFGGTTNLFAAIELSGSGFIFRLADGSTATTIEAQTGFFRAGGTRIVSGAQYTFNNNAGDPTISADTGIARDAAAAVRITNGSTGIGSLNSLYTRFGAGSPEGVVTAPVGAIYSRTDGGASTTLYVKESGAGNTGWIAK
jgi:hypothetical protein